MGSKRKPNPLPKKRRLKVDSFRWSAEAQEEGAKACLFEMGDKVTYSDADAEPSLPGRITDVDPDTGEITVAWSMTTEEETEYLREMVKWHEKKSAKQNSLIDILVEELFHHIDEHSCMRLPSEEPFYEDDYE